MVPDQAQPAPPWPWKQEEAPQLWRQQLRSPAEWRQLESQLTGQQEQKQPALGSSEALLDGKCRDGCQSGSGPPSTFAPTQVVKLGCRRPRHTWQQLQHENGLQLETALAWAVWGVEMSSL